MTLRELGVTELELVGVCTQICVLYTAADARMLNYNITVRKECVASFDEDAHAFALKEMENSWSKSALKLDFDMIFREPPFQQEARTTEAFIF